MTISKKKLKALDFHFVHEIKNDVYEIVYAKDIAENEITKGEVLDECVCFWSNENCDHRCCVDFEDILLAGIIIT